MMKAKPAPQARSIVKRAKILSVATELFLENGYEGVSVDTVVQLAGGSKTNVYSYFGDKAGLFAAVVQEICRQIVESFVDVNLDGLALEDALRTYGLAFLRAILGKEALRQHRMIVAESARFPDIGRIWFAVGPERAYEGLATYLEMQQKAGSVRVGPAKVFAVQFLDMISFNVHMRTMTTGTALPKLRELKEIVDNAVGIFLDGARSGR